MRRAAGGSGGSAALLNRHAEPSRSCPAPAPASRPFDLEQLLAVCGRPGVSEFALAAGVDRITVHRWRRQGMTSLQADRAAAAVGYHPAEVWGRQWWASAS